MGWGWGGGGGTQWPFPALCHRIVDNSCEVSFRSLWNSMYMSYLLTCKQVTFPATWALTCEYSMDSTATQFHSGPTRYRSQFSEAGGSNTALFQTSPVRDTDWFLKRKCTGGTGTAWRRNDCRNIWWELGLGVGFGDGYEIVVKYVGWMSETLYSI